MPDTTAYLFLALVLYFLVLALYVGSLVIRTRNLHKDEALIQQLRDEQ